MLKGYLKKRRNFVSLIVITILAIALPVTFYLAQNQQIFQPKAQTADSCDYYPNAPACFADAGCENLGLASQGCAQTHGIGSECSVDADGPFGDGCTAPDTGGGGTGSCPTYNLCSTLGYAEGQCNQGWQCVNGCVIKNNCTASGGGR